jgi:plastocyanin
MNNFIRSQRKNITFLLIAVLGIIIGLISVQMLTSKDIANGNSCSGICVAIEADGISPDELAVKIGEFVQFNSADGKSHELTTATDNNAGDHSNIHGGSKTTVASGIFGADEAWRVQFKQAGTYRLRDTKNANQEILVVVYEPKNEK